MSGATNRSVLRVLAARSFFKFLGNLNASHRTGDTAREAIVTFSLSLCRRVVEEQGRSRDHCSLLLFLLSLHLLIMTVPGDVNACTREAAVERLHVHNTAWHTHTLTGTQTHTHQASRVPAKRSRPLHRRLLETRHGRSYDPVYLMNSSRTIVACLQPPATHTLSPTC